MPYASWLARIEHRRSELTLPFLFGCHRLFSINSRSLSISLAALSLLFRCRLCRLCVKPWIRNNEQNTEANLGYSVSRFWLRFCVSLHTDHRVYYTDWRNEQEALSFSLFSLTRADKPCDFEIRYLTDRFVPPCVLSFLSSTDEYARAHGVVHIKRIHRVYIWVVREGWSCLLLVRVCVCVCVWVPPQNIFLIFYECAFLSLFINCNPLSRNVYMCGKFACDGRNYENVIYIFKKEIVWKLWVRSTG